jgi:hypothetical protein
MHCVVLAEVHTRMTLERYSRFFEHPLPPVSLGRLNRCARRVLKYCFLKRVHDLQVLAMRASVGAFIFHRGERDVYVSQ